MALSNDLISQFVKATQDKQEPIKESTAYGKIIKQGDSEYVQLDGSDLLTPISSTTVVQDGDRVMVTIKDHTAIVTGDLTTPAASNKEVVEIGNKISEFEIVIADKVTTEQLEAEIARIEKLRVEELEATNAKIETIEGKVAKIDTIETDILEVNEKLTAHEGEFTTIRADIADFEDVTAERIEAVEGDFHTLESDYASFQETTTKTLTAYDASIKNLETNSLTAEKADLRYANIDFSNIGEAAVEKLFSDSGIIKDLIMSEGKVTGELVGVTIKGDLIEGNTVKADKLVIKGEDGIYYKLNVDALGETTASSDEKYQNGLDGSVIVANSITAEKIAVDDLVAFKATIGGYHIDEHALYSGVKNSISNTTRGVFLGDDGQIAIGDTSNYLKYYLNEDNQYVLEIQANKIKFGASGSSIEEAINEVDTKVENLTDQTITAVHRYYLLQASTLPAPTKPTSYPPSSDWSLVEPTFQNSITSASVEETETTSTENGSEDLTTELNTYEEHLVEQEATIDDIILALEGKASSGNIEVSDSLYTTECTVYSNGTFEYSDISTSSSYEAAKLAYNSSKAANNSIAELTITTDSITQRVTEVETNVETLDTTVTENTTKIGTLETRTDGITASVTEVKTIQESNSKSIETLNDEISVLTNSVNAKMDADSVDIAITTALNNGVTKVNTTTGFTFDEEGLTISKNTSEMSTTIDEDGMEIKRGEDTQLKANNEGVVAYDLHAKTYLIVGSNSRFEDYEKNRKKQTGCFWVGNTEV